MKILAIGDVHNHINAAEEIASRYEETHKIVFVGDYFDDFHDGSVQANNTAFWLKESLKKPNRIHLFGNHDLNYTSYCEYNINGRMVKMYHCSGYDSKKDKIAKMVLKESDWSLLKLHYFQNNWHFTHAGISKKLFQHPIKELNDEYLNETMVDLTKKFHNREKTDLIGGAGYCRGGTIPVGGITWHDHNEDADPIHNIKQIYGHTPVNDIDVLEDNGGINICIDTGLSQVLEINEDGSFNIITTGFDNFYDPYKNINNKW